jgi:hypothetical protein
VNAGCQFSQRPKIPNGTREIFAEQWIAAPVLPERINMAEYRFSLVVRMPEMSEEEILDATDALGAAGCTDASIRGHADGMEVLFERTSDSLQAAISSAVSDVERAGFQVERVEIEREAMSV